MSSEFLKDLDFDRLRPLRATAEIRRANADVSFGPEHLMQPFFVVDGQDIDEPIPTLEDVSHLSIDRLLIEVGKLRETGVRRVLLFGVVGHELRDASASAGTRDDGLVPRAVKALKEAYPDLVVATDVCVCAYTDHGHCGVLRGHEVDNDASLPLLARMALAHARAGADIVAPSAMMDGQVAAIRSLLDAEGYGNTKVMGYSAKYASSLYGPFRDAADSAPSFGDRKSYQMDFRTRDQGMAEATADLNEGAAIIMVKPATFYLDQVARIKNAYPEVPMAAYHTSGEYMMVRHGARAGLFSLEQGMMENLYALRRAGTDILITYAAGWAATLLKGENQ